MFINDRYKTLYPMPSLLNHTIDRRSFLRGMIGSAAAAALVPHVLGQTNATPPIAAAVIPPTGNFLVRTPDGLTLAAQAQGDPAAPEILLIHGLGQCRLSWSRQLADPALAGFRIVSFDLRGHGDSDKPADEAAYSDGARWADDLAAVIAAARLRRPVLVGWSLGGFVLAHYLKRHGAATVAAVNLVDAVTRFSPDFLTPASLDFAKQLGSEDLAVRAAAVAGFLEGCFATPPPRAELDRMLVFNGMVPRALQRSILKMSDAGLDEALAGYPGPILVTFGEKDARVRREMAERQLAQNSRAKLSLYPQAGHSPFYEDAARFNRELAALVLGTL